MAPPTFNELQKDSNLHEGRKVVLGGYILELRNELVVSILTILQAPLDFQNRPNLRDQSEGRFIARTKEFLEPEIYKKDRRVTVRGKVAGTLTQALGDRVYQYPLIEAEAFQLWTDETYYDWRWDRYWYGWGYPRYPLHRPMRPFRWPR